MLRFFKSLATALVLSSHVSAGDAWLFTSFHGNGDGLHLSYSSDALHWTAIDRIFLEPTVGSKLMRDSHLMQGPDGVFHLVWTTGWKDTGIGHATSRDLVNWSDQDYFPFMAKTPGTQNCWAPETFYDDKTRQYIVCWASDVDGRFPKTKSKDRMNNRTYFVTTRDFKNFSEPAILLDPGFDHIDATILPFKGKYTIVFKEGDQQAKGKWGPIHAAVADSPLGPYHVLPKPLVTDRAEGPTLAMVGDKVRLYVDFYANQHYGAYETSDWKTWTDVSSQAEVAEGQRHGTVLPVSTELLKSLVPDAVTPPPPAALPGLTADPHIAAFGDTYYIYPTTDGSEGWMATSFHGWSSKDLKHWKDEGVILDLPRNLKWADVRAWAPAIASKNGKYYYYYSASQSIGVAVSDKPMGPFKDPLGKPLVAKAEYPCQSIDPMVFVDDDGAAYLYFGQGKCMAVKLNDDMISFDHAAAKPIQPKGYNEGSFVFKRKGVYYLSWSEFDTRDPRYSVAYATSASPLGPYEKAPENPILQQKGAVKGAGHHSILQIPGLDEWVIAYHRFKIPGGNGYNRETCLSPLRFDDKGAILPVDVFESVPETPVPKITP
ncbi:MAG: family 43 glycosylhydrolase [Luteolibacter sp.]